jgi:tetratricopeptide (TPR) repeat protein
MRPRAVLSLIFLGVAALAFPLVARAAESGTSPAIAAQSTNVLPSNAVAPPSAAIVAARAKVAAGDQIGAMRDLAVYVPNHPEDLAAARLLGDLYFRLPDFKRAEATWRAILVRVPGDAATHTRLGSLYAAEDRMNDALSEFEKSLPSPTGFAGLVKEHRRLGDLGAFEASYVDRIQFNPQDTNALWYYGSILHELREFSQAQLYLDRAVALAPESCPLLIDAGNNNIDLTRYDIAVATLTRCLDREPRNYVALVDIGEAYRLEGLPDRARACFDGALVARPDGAEALIDTGYLQDAAGNWKSAVSEYLAAMSADPLQAAAYIDLGFDYSEHHLYALAEAAFIKGISAEPNSGRLHYLLATAYTAQGKVDLARDQYRRAIDTKDDLDVTRAAETKLAQLPRNER